MSSSVTAVAGSDPNSGDPIITVSVIIDPTGAPGGSTVTATILRNDGTFVRGASPLFPLSVSNVSYAASIIDRTAPYGLETTYTVTPLFTSSSPPFTGTPSPPSPPVVMDQAPDTVALFNRLGWPADQDASGELEGWLAGIGSLLQAIDSLCSDDFDLNGDYAPGWSQLLDVNRAPTAALPWLAQFVGVRLNPALRDDIQRFQIENPIGFARGTPAAILAAVTQYLLPGYSATMTERDTSAYHLAISIPTAGISGVSTCGSIASEYTACSQLPTAFATCKALWNNNALISAAVQATIPAGLVASISYV